MAKLNDVDRLKLLRTMIVSRCGDLREQSLIRQGKGWFHVSGMGHEALAVAGFLLREGDFFAGYYRDRPIALARGVDNYDLALAFFAKRDSASGGRQMPAHYSDRKRGIFSVASVVGSSLLPATGMAWALKLDQKPNLVLTTIGDAGTRQGDFFEAVAFAIERQLPVVFLVEDNGIGISSVTAKVHPLGLDMLNRSVWQIADGCDAESVFEVIHPAFNAARSGAGPQFIWMRTERISSHSSADDHRKYRSEEELSELDGKDPLNRLKEDLINRKVLTADGYRELFAELENRVRQDYQRAFAELDPSPEDLLKHVHGPAGKVPALAIASESPTLRMVDAINGTFQAALRSNTDVVFFGQDIEDPKGGVFSLTKGLSTHWPNQVFNSPLAESTIVGVAVGMAAYGKRPVFEIQFTDYIWPGFNQLVTHLSTLHWRSNGEWAAPAIIYAPYGAYLPGGALWHSQANESALAHFPGLQIAIPSTPEDAAGLFWSALHGNTPTLILIPKHLMWHPRELHGPIQPVPFGKAVIRSTGDAITVVTWGNCTEVVEQALELLGAETGVEWIDLRSVTPIDWLCIRDSVLKTGRLLVVQEDAESCSVGQNIIARLVADSDLFNALQAPPCLLAKPDVHIGYHPTLEFAALPDKKAVVRKIRELVSAQAACRNPAVKTPPSARDNPAFEKLQQSMAMDDPDLPASVVDIRVPILGEGITAARVVTLLVEPGTEIAPDDALCEVETDKALFPIESPVAGTLLEWCISEEDEVQVNAVIARVEVASADHPKPPQTQPGSSAQAGIEAALRPGFDSDDGLRKITEGGLSPRIVAQLQHVVPAHMTVKAGWRAIRDARVAAKQQLGAEAPSPTLMVAWCLVQAMKKHPVFCCTTSPANTLSPLPAFDFGVAVSLARDALETAVIENASELNGREFIAAYQQGLQAVRLGNSRSKAHVPLILTSMGGFDVRDAQPLVVPPAIATLFLGEAHWEPRSPAEFSEQVALCLSFDHRWLNGAAGARFLQDVKRTMETFTLDELYRQ